MVGAAGLDGSDYIDYEKYWQDPIRENETLWVLAGRIVAGGYDELCTVQYSTSTIPNIL